MKKEDTAHFPSTPWVPDREDRADDLSEMSQTSVTSFEEAMMDYAKFYYWLLKDRAITAAPMYHLSEILTKMTVDTLRDIYREYLLKPAAGRLKKQQLIESLLKAITDQNQLEEFIMTLPNTHWEFFKDVLKAKEINDDCSTHMIDRAQSALSQGYLYLFDHKGGFTYLVPDEVKAAYKQIDKPYLHEHMKARFLLDQFACAAVNLYGVLSLEELAGIVNENNHNKEDDRLSEDMLEFCLIGNEYYNSDYIMERGFIADCHFGTEDLDGLDQDEVQSLLKIRQGKPRYFPGIKTFLRYADPDYYEQTPQIKALKKELRQVGLSVAEAEDLIDTLHDKITAHADLSQLLGHLKEYGVGFDNEQAANKLLQAIVKVHNSTRLWSNYGHTPDEMAKLLGGINPRGISFGKNMTKMLVEGELDLDELKESLWEKPLINSEFKNSVMSEIERVKKMKDQKEKVGTPDNIIPFKKPGRNDPCPCGSGLKYKKCCGKNAGDAD